MHLQAQRAEEAWGREKKALMERLERLQKANKARRAELDDLTAQVQPCPERIMVTCLKSVYASLAQPRCAGCSRRTQQVVRYWVVDMEALP